MAFPSPVEPCDFTVFGGTGDLALRKLLPALYLRDRDGQLPDGFRVIGVSRHTADDDAYRAMVRDALDPARQSRGPRRRGGRATPRPAAPRRARHRGRRGVAPAARAAQGRRRQRGRHPRLLPRRRARALRHHLRAPRRGGPGDRALARRAGEADGLRPRHRAPRQRGRRPGLRRVQHLPHRPLPRQGERAEPARHALRQHLPRAAVEQPLGRPRADHGRRVAGRGGARLLLRPLRRAARHGAEPPPPAALPRGDGAADLRRPRDRARREAQGAPGAAPDDARAGRPRRRRRAVRRRALRRRAREGVRRRGGARLATPRPSWRCAPRCRTGAGPGCRSTCAPASGCPSGSRRSWSSSRSRRTRCSPTARARPSPTASTSGSSPTRACACT